MSFADQISKDRGQPATVRIGTVTSLAPLTVNIQDTGITNMGVLDGYVPAVGDYVAMLGQSSVSADGSSWLLLGRITDPAAAIFLAASAVATDPASVNTTSLTYVPLTATVDMGVVFSAPSSGKVAMHWRASTAPAVANTAWASFRLGIGNIIGAGAVVQAATDNVALMFSAVAGADFGTSTLLTGLTPGVVYNVQVQHRTTGGTSFWARREIIVIPAP